MITREQVADLQPGDVVELRPGEHPGVVVTGPVHVTGNGDLQVGTYILRTADGEPYVMYRRIRSLTVVSRAPRPFYVNHDRAGPIPGDVVRDADDDGYDGTWAFVVRDWGNRNLPWLPLHGEDRRGCLRSHLPARLRLLVDGETGQVVP